MALVGNHFSTLSAHFSRPPVHLFLPGLSGSCSAAKKRRGARVDQPSSQPETAATYSRFSSDHQRDESITDQQRKCHESAAKNGHRVLPENDFADEAVSGTKLDRDGLNAMLRAAEAGEFQVLYFHSLSRLARESVITMPMLKKLVYVFKVRVISVTEGIDSDRDGWELIASVLSLLGERYIKELGENVFRGQEGVVLAGISVGDYRFGYASEPIPGSEAGRKGRQVKSRMKYIIDPVSSPWVVRIFHWFVNERRSLRGIVRELNARGAPKDHRATTPKWHHDQVTNVLESEKYIGKWPWGEMKNVRDPFTGKTHQELRPEEECGKWVREFPHLRIIDDETFAKAQQFLEENYQAYEASRRQDGTLKWSKSGSRNGPPRHLLQKLIVCGNPDCSARFNVGGTGSSYMFCPNYVAGTCTCQTKLQRERAERLILDAIGQRILHDPVWFKAVFEQLLKSWQRGEDRVPVELSAAQTALADVDRKITRLVDSIEAGLHDGDIQKRLEDRRDERRELQTRIEKLTRADDSRTPQPTEEWLRARLAQLGETLTEHTPAAAYALRQLVGGQIIVTEIRREGRQRHYLQGRFTIKASSVLTAFGFGEPVGIPADAKEVEGVVDHNEEIVIDFVDPNPLDAESEEAKALYDQNLLEAEIAEQLNCSPSNVTKLLHHWYDKRGLEMPDGRARRSRLARKSMNPAVYQQISEDVKKLCDDGLLYQEVAERLGYDQSTISKAFACWYESRGLKVPDGRTRLMDIGRTNPGRRGRDESSPDESTNAV